MPTPLMSPNEFLSRIADALGLGPIRSVEIRASIGEVPTVRVEKFVRPDRAAPLARVFERFRLEPLPEPTRPDAGPGPRVLEFVRHADDFFGPFIVVLVHDRESIPWTILFDGRAWTAEADTGMSPRQPKCKPLLDRPCREVTYRPA